MGKLCWFAVSVRPGYERAVCNAITNKDYECFLPTYECNRQRHDRIKKLQLPLFSGYVFCRFDLESRTAPIVTTPGVKRIVSFANRPEAIPDSEIAAIQAVVASGYSAGPWTERAVAGSKVRLTAGALAGIEGKLVRVRNRDRLVVSISLLQRYVAVEIESAWVSLDPEMPPRSWIVNVA